MLASQLTRFVCHTCRPPQKAARGCTSKPAQPLKLLGEVLDRCPMRGYYEDPVGYNALFQRYRWMKEGCLADPGTILDQSAVFVELSNVITMAADEASQEGRRKQEEERNASARAAKAKGPTGNRRPRSGRGGRR